jgi:hypothetical protein
MAFDGGASSSRRRALCCSSFASLFFGACSAISAMRRSAPGMPRPNTAAVAARVAASGLPLASTRNASMVSGLRWRPRSCTAASRSARSGRKSIQMMSAGLSPSCAARAVRRTSRSSMEAKSLFASRFRMSRVAL